MNCKILLAFLITTLLICSYQSSASIAIQNTNSTVKKKPDSLKIINPLGAKNTFGTGGWHEVEYRGFYGKNFTSIEGDWNYWGSNSIEQSPNDGNDACCNAYFLFNDSYSIGDTCVKYLTTSLKYKCFSFFGDGPQIKLYKWDSESWWVSGQLGRYSDWHIGSVTKTGDAANKYVDDEGQVHVIIHAWDSDDFWSGDHFVNNWVLLEFQTADEEIYQASYSLRDDDEDGYPDGIELSIDADVGDPGDGTTVNVTAYCELVDPNENVVDSDTVTWTIIDWEYDPENISLSALGEPNGKYIIKIWLVDEFGNLEDYVEGSVELIPDPQYRVTFYSNPSSSGMINFDNHLYNNGQSTEVSRGTYDIEAKPNQGYKFTQWIPSSGISVENIYAKETKATVSENGTLTVAFEAKSDLKCYGSLSWIDIPAGSTITGSFTVANEGGQDSMLDWQIVNYPNWGTWTFTPESGTSLPSGQSIEVQVEVTVPKEEKEFTGTIKIVNSEDPNNDYDYIDIYLKTPKIKELHKMHFLDLLIQKLLEQYPMFSELFLNFNIPILGR
jgi:hypothetical protein